jgi:hypothetical protein
MATRSLSHLVGVDNQSHDVFAQQQHYLQMNSKGWFLLIQKTSQLVVSQCSLKIHKIHPQVHLEVNEVKFLRTTFSVFAFLLSELPTED